MRGWDGGFDDLGAQEMSEAQPEPTQMHWFYCWRQHLGASHTVCLLTNVVACLDGSWPVSASSRREKMR